MKNSATKRDPVSAVDVLVTDDTLKVELSDGRSLSVPLSWYPRLLHGSQEERRNWQLGASGQGIHWPQLDEDISVEGLIAGKRSVESESSLKRWMSGRSKD